MERYLEIVKRFGLLLLFFVLVSAVAVGESAVTVTITQTSSTDDGGDTVTNTYSKEIKTTESTDVEVTGSISEDGPSITTNVDDTATNMDDTTTESVDPAAMPEFKIGETTTDEFAAEMSKWISSVLDESPIVRTDDFPLDVDKI